MHDVVSDTIKPMTESSLWWCQCNDNTTTLKCICRQFTVGDKKSRLVTPIGNATKDSRLSYSYTVVKPSSTSGKALRIWSCGLVHYMYIMSWMNTIWSNEFQYRYIITGIWVQFGKYLCLWDIQCMEDDYHNIIIVVVLICEFFWKFCLTFRLVCSNLHQKIHNTIHKQKRLLIVFDK